MTIDQIVFYGVIVVILLWYFRRAMRIRSLKHYTPSELKESLRSRSDVVLLDVRTEKERKSGGIKGSFHIPLHQINRRADELRKYQAKEIVCYCQSGNRSVSAALKLRKRGFQTANLTGGIGSWNFEGGR